MLKDYYAILGVPEKATAAELQAAWRIRSAVLHPDRFDRISQAGQWAQANSMFAELREAYDILSNVDKRARYDRARVAAGGPARPSDAPRAADRPGSPGGESAPPIDSDVLQTRIIDASALPVAALRALARRPKNATRLFRHTASPLPNILGVVVGTVLLPLWWSASTDGSPTGVGMLAVFGGFAIAAMLVAYNGLRLWMAWASPFGRGLVVTPFYFAQLMWDRCQLVPLVALKDLGLTHHYRNGIYERTTFHVQWVNAVTDFTVGGKKHAELLSKLLVDAGNRMKAEFAAGHGAAMVARFAFGSNLPSGSGDKLKSPRVARLERLALLGGVAAAAIATVTFAAGPTPAASALPTPVAASGAGTPGAITGSAQPSVIDPFLAPSPAASQPDVGQARVGDPDSLRALPTPSNGSQTDYTHREDVAPFRLDARGKAGYFLIRLRDVETNVLVADIFVRGGQVAEVNVPLGRYTLLLATGRYWLGHDELFGNGGSYARADQALTFSEQGDRVLGHEIELEESIEGNLKQTSVRRADF